MFSLLVGRGPVTAHALKVGLYSYTSIADVILSFD